jgi:transcriptional regulator with XRE-family HTH domain
MRLDKLKTHGTLVAEQQTADPAFREEWESKAFARAVAAQVIGYRADQGLSQRALAERLGVRQPQVVRIESGEHSPELDTLMRLAHVLGIEFTLDIVPAEREPKLITKAARETRALATHTARGARATLSARAAS